MGCSFSMIDLGIYYYDKKNYEMMKIYYNMAIELKRTAAMNNLALYYNLIEHDRDNAIKYYLMAIQHGYTNLSKLEKYLSNSILLYNILINSTIKNNIINDKILMLEKENDIIIYKNKCRFAIKFNSREKCLICLREDVYQLDIGCGHTVCDECYKPKMKCYFPFCNS